MIFDQAGIPSIMKALNNSFVGFGYTNIQPANPIICALKTSAKYNCIQISIEENMLVNTPFVKCSMLFLSPTTEHWSIVKSAREKQYLVPCHGWRKLR